MRGLWRLPGFGRLAAAYALNELVWFVGTLSLSLLVYRRTGSALGSAAFFLCSQGVPALIAPVIVARLDQASPRRLLAPMYWTEGILFGVLAWFAHRFVLTPVLVIVVLDGVIALTARSLAGGARTEILKPVDKVREGGAVQSMMFSTAYLIGPLLAGGIAALGGTVAALLAACGIFAVIGFSLVSDTIPRSIVHDGPAEGRLRAGLAYARRNRTVANLLGLQTIAFAIFSIPTPIEVVLCIRTLHAGSAGYGALMSAWGGGAVLGSLAYTRWRRVPVRLIVGAACVTLTVGFALMAVSPTLLVALVGAAVAGIGNGIAGGGFITELMEITPQSWTALVSSLSQSLGVLAPGLGIVLGGVLTTVFGVRATFGIGAAGCAVCAVLVAWLLAPARLVGPPAEPLDGGEAVAAAGMATGAGAATGAEAATGADVAAGDARGGLPADTASIT